MNEFDILRSAAQAVLEKDTATEGEITLARLVIAYGEKHRDVTQKTLLSLRDRSDALLDCFRSLRALLALFDEGTIGFWSLPVIDDAKKSLEKASRYG